MVKYKVFKERLPDENGKMYTTYGIKAIEQGCEIARISDVGVGCFPVWRLCRKCNRLKLDAVHLHDVAEDFAAEW
ncbi:MAG: hypothetical protein IJ299_05265 [Oscillospiraceae bacterium]|nr:hypothetical protein [Oscillospiraceae bacterium]